MEISDPNSNIEQKLIKNCKQKDNIEAKEALYKHYYSYAMSISLRYAYTKDEAVMIVNDSFLKVYDNIHSYNSKYPFRAWFKRILINTAIDRYRSNITRIKNVEPITTVDTLPNHYEDIVSKLTVNDIMALLNELTEHQRIIFNLCEVEGYSHKEIAQKLEIAISTSRSSLTRAKAKLRELFKLKFGTSYE